MRLGEIALFTVPPKLTQGIQDTFPSIPADATLQFEIELISWLKVVDVCEDGGIIKKTLHRTEAVERAKEKDEVTGETRSLVSLSLSHTHNVTYLSCVD